MEALTLISLFSSNIDFNEAGLDALIQTAVCDQINWRPNSRKMIVLVSDAGFHVQGNNNQNEFAEI